MKNSKDSATKRTAEELENPVILENETAEGAQDASGSESENAEESAVDLMAKKLSEALKALTESQEQVMRLSADFDNFRKRKEREMADAIRYANEDVLKQLLPILDNFGRTLGVIEKTDNLAAIKEGITLVDNNMRKQLQKVGLEPIEAIGQPFDLNLHEAISSIPVEEEAKKGLVIDEAEKGYRLRDRVIRFSKVIVGE